LSRARNRPLNAPGRSLQATPRPLRNATAVRKGPAADPPALDILPEHRSEVELLDAAVAAKDSGSAIANRCDLVVGIEVVEEEAVVVRPLIGEDAAQNLRLARELQEQAVQVVTSIRI